MAIPATDVFLSYKAEERKRLIPLVEALEAEGFSVWWDQNISGGANWREEIETHLDAAKVVIVVWSKRTIGPEGRFVRDEAGQAQEAGHYLPITIDNVRPPLGFREVQALDLSNWWGKRDDPRFKVLADTIRARLEGKEIKHHLVMPRGPAVSRRTAIAGGVGAIAIAGTGGWLLLKPGAAEAKRIAVLPFANLSVAQDQAYFAEGVAEELRGALSRIGLEVIGRASSDAVKGLDTKAAAAKLGVAHILSGSVRRSPETIRVSAQLVNGSNGVEKWSQAYDRAPGDEIKIQTDIATSVAQALSLALGQAGKAALTLGGTTDAAAQDLYLRARDLMLKVGDADALGKVIELIDAAIARDSNYADAYRLKSTALHSLGTNFPTGPTYMTDKLRQAEATARQAIALAPRLGSGYAVLAQIESAQFEFAAAVQSMRKGLELSPESPAVISRASIFMQYFGDPHKALDLADRVIALDPLRGISYVRRAEILFTLGEYVESIAATRKNLELDPKSYGSRRIIADCLVLMNRPAEAKEEYAKEPADDALRLTGEAILAARARDLSGAERIIARMREVFGDAASVQYAAIYAQAGQANRGFAALETAIRVKDAGLIELKSHPWYNPIRGDPRYAALLKRLNFPTWR